MFQGAGESGKSTIFKQVRWTSCRWFNAGSSSTYFFLFLLPFFYLVLIKFALTFLPVANVQIKLLFQTGFDEAELRSYTSVIHANVYQTIKVRNTEKGVLVYSLLPGALRELLTKVITLSMN